MARPDFSGARGSNAGDDFHELWALRHALTLLHPQTDLRQLMVEGVVEQDENRSSTSWDGVDCTLYHAEQGGEDVTKIIIEQLKYSSASPDTKWTVARLIHSSSKTGNNSIVRKLASAWAELCRLHPGLASKNAIVVRLISNQQASAELVAALAAVSSSTAAKRAAEDAQKLQAASGLTEDRFKRFIALFDIATLGLDTRLSIETQIIRTIAGWTDERQSSAELMRFIRRKMAPDERGRPIAKEDILAHFGVSDLSVIFPCPNRLKPVANSIHRAATADIARLMTAGRRLICMHGLGGAGKTTVVQQLPEALPQGSAIVVFDCYGAGTYMNSNAYRHPPQYAFPQIINELSARLRIPYLFVRSPDADYPRLFMKQLSRAAELVASANPDALLVIVIDAADNSIDAAATAQPASHSFVPAFLMLEAPPGNVRFLVTARTGRLERLALPASFERIPLTGFTQAETAAHVRAHWPDTPDAWIEDFHQLSNGLPRVQAYAVEAAQGDRARALQYLRPAGKGLTDIFRGQIDNAIRKQANPDLFARFCAGLIALPRPIPMPALAATIGLSEQHCLDITSDLAPGLTNSFNLVGFADEDFETYVREQAAPQVPNATQAAAAYLFEQRKTDAYAATHVAGTLYAAGRSADVLRLVAPDEAPAILSDPVHKREVEIKRLQTAVKVCRETGNIVESVLTLIRGARAVKAETAITRLLSENADLSVQFARDVAVRAILRDPARIEEHGAFLSGLAAHEARRGHSIDVRELRRQLQAWFGRRYDEWNAARKKHPQYEPKAWPVEPEDVAGLLEASVLTDPPQRTIDMLHGWPRRDAFSACRIVAHRMIARGDMEPLRALLSALPDNSPWRFMLTVPLALAGQSLTIGDFEQCLRSLARRRLVTTEGLSRIWSSTEPIEASFYDSVMFACEIALSKGINPDVVRPILEALSHESLRRAGHTRLSQTAALDISIRALALLSELDGKSLVYDTYVVQPTEPKDAVSNPDAPKQPRKDDEKEFIAPLLPIYVVRAKAFLNKLPARDVAAAVEAASGAMRREKWRVERHHSAGYAFDRAAKSIAQLIAIDGVDLAQLRASALSLITSDLMAGKASGIYTLFALRHDQHVLLLQEIAARAEEIKQLKWSARDRSDALMTLCRSLASFSPDDAQLLFNDAVAIAEDIDEESIHELALIRPIAAKAVRVLQKRDRRLIAQRLVAAASEMALRLDSPDAFPWSSIMKALVDLDTPVALAAIAQWDDVERVQLGTTLPKFIRHALSIATIDAATSVALLPLLIDASDKLICDVVRAAANRPGLVDLIARDELLEFGRAARSEVNRVIAEAAASAAPTGFARKLVDTAAFLSEHAPEKEVSTSTRTDRDDLSSQNTDTLSSIDWTDLRVDDADSLAAFLDTVHAQVNASDRLFYARKLLDAAQARVPLAKRAAYLSALAKARPTSIWRDDIARSLIDCATAWFDTPSVKAWCRDDLPGVIADDLPNFARYLAQEQAVLNKAMPLIGSDKAIRDALLAGVEAHFDALDAATVYALAGLIGQSCSDQEAATIIDRHTAQLIDDFPAQDRRLPDPTSIPDDAVDAVARFLYANLSDVDIHRRWRAAHAARRWIVCGNDRAVAALVSNYTRKSDPEFRDPTAPFHWHAARLWLMIAFGRAAVDMPQRFVDHLDWLKSLVSDALYPHLLVRSYAQDVIDTVCAATGRDLAPLDKAALAKFTRGGVAPQPLPKGETHRAVHMRNLEGKRFQFDSMDTLPYWYEPAVRMFTDVTGDEFLAEAERWIVDQWGVTGFEHRWDTQPRRQKYGEGFESMHRHGSLPQRERYHTHLEWHAMWCAIGRLMATRPLVRKTSDDVDPLDDKLESSKLTLPPRWLADLREAKPLHPDWWFAPDDVSDTWLDAVGLDDALAFLNGAPQSGCLVVHAHAEACSDKHTISKNVTSALVDPRTAADLMRALQSADSEQDYYLPDEEHEQQIGKRQFRLLGWRATSHRDTAFDGEDPLRYGISAPHVVPGQRLSGVMDMHAAWRDQSRVWLTATGQVAFSNHGWGDTRGDEPERQRRYDLGLRSSGALISADRSLLRQFLTTLNMDLIVEVTITKRNFSYESSSRGKEEDHKSQPHAFILLFRQNGDIETVEGPAGTWTASG